MKRVVGLFLSLAVIIGGFGFYAFSGNVPVNDKKTVTVTTTFLGDLVGLLAEDTIHLNVLMGPGIDPHLYQASASDLSKLSEADLVVYGGVHLEGKLGETLEKLAFNGKHIVDSSEAIDRSQLIVVSEGENTDEMVYDPHIWFDTDLWRIVAKTVLAELVVMNPEYEQLYTANFMAYMNELDALDQYVASRIAEIPEQSRYLITAHDAFNYFARVTGMEVRGIQGVSTQSEASTNDISQLADFITEHQVRAIFVESSVSPKLIQALQEAVRARGFSVAIGGELFSDSTGDADTPEGTYIGMYKHNVDTIVEALKGSE